MAPARPDAPARRRPELDLEPGKLGAGSEPGSRGKRHPTRLLSVDHLERMPEAVSPLLLDLDHQQAPASAQYEIELVTAGPRICLEQAIAAEPIVLEGAALAAIHAAS